MIKKIIIVRMNKEKKITRRLFSVDACVCIKQKIGIRIWYMCYVVFTHENTAFITTQNAS